MGEDLWDDLFLIQNKKTHRLVGGLEHFPSIGNNKNNPN
jgi:hypothetical protein